jgi:hypothetical protein
MKGTAQSAPIPKGIWEANLNQYPTPGLVSETRPGVYYFVVDRCVFPDFMPQSPTGLHGPICRWYQTRARIE